MALKWMEHEFQFGIFRPEKQDYLADVPLLPEISDGTTQKVVFHSLFKRIFRKILINGKQPLNKAISDLPGASVSKWG